MARKRRRATKTATATPAGPVVIRITRNLTTPRRRRIGDHLRLTPEQIRQQGLTEGRDFDYINRNP